MKRCTKCGRLLPRVEFAKDKTKLDGLRSNCKHCQREYRQKHKKEYCEYRKQWDHTHPESVKKRSKIKRERFPERERARHFARYHIPLKPQCELCGSTKRLEHHHPDYNFPEVTVTVCKPCHEAIHNPS